MTPDPRTPVIAGVGQALRRPASLDELASPLDLIAEAGRSADRDTGAPTSLLARVSSVRVVDMLSWRSPNPAAEVAARLGLAPAETVMSTAGGNSPQLLVAHAADAIAAGELDVALVAGAEAMYSRVVARRMGARAAAPSPESTTPPTVVLGDGRPGTSGAEQARSLLLPVQIYPLFENALRAASGQSIDEHQRAVSELWSRFSAVAAGNPFAWTPERRAADEIRTVTADNRMVGFPYPKLMNANIQVDQGAALLLCSLETALAAGVPRDRLVFPWVAAEGHDHWFVSDRWELHRSPAIAACGRAALSHAGIGIDEVAHVDLYSCFPSAVQLGAEALGLSLDDPARDLTVTGGLTFAGGPGNNYVSHSIATMVQRLRADPGTLGLVTALGWYATKHSVAVYGTEPAPAGWSRQDRQAEIDRLPRRGSDPSFEGAIDIETYTVLHERDGSPSLGIVGGLTPAGLRVWGSTHRAEVIAGLLEADPIGRRVSLGGDGGLTLP